MTSEAERTSERMSFRMNLHFLSDAFSSKLMRPRISIYVSVSVRRSVVLLEHEYLRYIDILNRIFVPILISYKI